MGWTWRIWGALVVLVACGDDDAPNGPIDSGGFDVADTSMPPPPPDELSALRAASISPIGVERGPAGTIESLRAQVPASGAGPEARARDFLGTHGPLFGVSDPQEELVTTAVQPFPGAAASTVVLDRRRGGVPVFGASIRIVVRDNGEIVAVMNDDPGTGEPASTTPSLTADAARAAAFEQLGATAPTPDTSDPDLVVLSLPMLLHEVGDLVLVWMLDVMGPSPDTTLRCFVDATSGELLWSYSLAPDVIDRRIFDAHDMFDKPALAVEANLVLDETGAQSDVLPDEAMPAFELAQRVDDYFRHTFDLNHYTGEPDVGSIDVFVRYEHRRVVSQCAATPPLCAPEDVCHAGRCFAPAGNNAFFSPIRVAGDPFATGSLWFTPDMIRNPSTGELVVDVFAHELTHAITRHHAGLVYAVEPGAINESLSDVFASFVDTDTRWTMGDHSALGVIRDLATPNAHGQPSHVRDTQRIAAADVGPCAATMPQCLLPPGAPLSARRTCISGRCYDTSVDHGGVHRNSGIPNHAAYLLVNGGSGGRSPDPPVTVRAIDRDGLPLKTERIYYGALGGKLLGPFTDFFRLRSAIASSCFLYWLLDAFDVEQRDCGAVLNAFAAVGVGERDFDEDTFTDSTDVCPMHHDPDQRDRDRNGTGDACEMAAPDAGPATMDAGRGDGAVPPCDAATGGCDAAEPPPCIERSPAGTCLPVVSATLLGAQGPLAPSVPTAGTRVSVLDAAGAVIGSAETTTTMGDDSSFEIGPLPMGTFVLRLERDDLATITRAFEITDPRLFDQGRATVAPRNTACASDTTVFELTRALTLTDLVRIGQATTELVDRQWYYDASASPLCVTGSGPSPTFAWDEDWVTTRSPTGRLVYQLTLEELTAEGVAGPVLWSINPPAGCGPTDPACRIDPPAIFGTTSPRWRTVGGTPDAPAPLSASAPGYSLLVFSDLAPSSVGGRLDFRLR